MTEQDLHVWLSKMKQGDRDAFKHVYEHIRDDVYRTVSFLINNRQDVHDVVSEVYIELFKSLPNYDRRQPFRSWLNGLIIRQAHNWNRKIWRKLRLFERSTLLAEEPPDAGTENELLQNERREEVGALLQKLSYKQREVLVLRYYHEYSFEEIADLLSIPVGTVKSRHRLGLEKLRKHAERITENKEAVFHVH